MPETSCLSSTEEIVADIRAGKIVIIVDAEDRENEGDLVMAAEDVSSEAINFMITYGKGLVCMPISGQIASQLALEPMVQNNTSKFSTAFTTSIGAKEGVTTGISAHDRAHTIKTVLKEGASSADLTQPGHVFPIIAHASGLEARQGHTEASVEFAKIAGKKHAAVICEVIKEDGTMARLKDLQQFAAQHNLKIGSIAGLIEYTTKLRNAS